MRYTITLFEYWHSGAIRSAGKSKEDYKVQKDEEDNTPFYAAKTLNGILVENIEKIKKYDKNVNTNLYDKIEPQDAKLPQVKIDRIIKYGLHSSLYDSMSFTAIGKEGTAKKGSLRGMEVSVPMRIEGSIALNGCDAQLIARAMKMIKRLGYKRNRGFGRCDVALWDDTGEDDMGKEIAWQPSI